MCPCVHLISTKRIMQNKETKKGGRIEGSTQFILHYIMLCYINYISSRK
jgi:hypothetical protein